MTKVVFLYAFIFYFDDDDDGGSHSSSSSNGSNGCSQHINNTFIIQVIPGASTFVLTQKNYLPLLFFFF